MEIRKVSGPEPLYCQYPTQCRPQPAYIWLDCDKEILWADYDGNISGMPIEVWHRRTLRWELVNIKMSARKVNAALKDIAPFAERIIDGYEPVWDGHNEVGSYSDDAKKAMHRIISILEGYNYRRVFSLS